MLAWEVKSAVVALKQHLGSIRLIFDRARDIVAGSNDFSDGVLVAEPDTDGMLPLPAPLCEPQMPGIIAVLQQQASVAAFVKMQHGTLGVLVNCSDRQETRMGREC